MKKIQNYTIAEHRDIFSAWCACTASRASQKCRFKVQTGIQVLKLSKIDSLSLDQALPNFNHDNFDSWHDQMCASLIESAKKMKVQGFSYGVAAKMLNCYIKACYLSNLDKYPFIHPPIDRLLLGNLSKQNFANKGALWKEFELLGWSNFSRDDYQRVIQNIKLSLPANQPIWKIEVFWNGHQK